MSPGGGAGVCPMPCQYKPRIVSASFIIAVDCSTIFSFNSCFRNVAAPISLIPCSAGSVSTLLSRSVVTGIEDTLLKSPKRTSVDLLGVEEDSDVSVVLTEHIRLLIHVRSRRDSGYLRHDSSSLSPRFHAAIAVLHFAPLPSCQYSYNVSIPVTTLSDGFLGVLVVGIAPWYPNDIEEEWNSQLWWEEETFCS
jgi:hypothetical protein